jgi:hypothetical protein
VSGCEVLLASFARMVRSCFIALLGWRRDEVSYDRWHAADGAFGVRQSVRGPSVLRLGDDGRVVEALGHGAGLVRATLGGRDEEKWCSGVSWLGGSVCNG